MTNEELAVLAQAGDRAAGAKLWECTRRLCFRLARRFFPLCERAGIEREDLEQEIYFGFREAVTAFNPTGGDKFTSYLKYPVWKACAAALGIRNGRAMEPRPASLQSPLDDAGGELQDLIEDETSGQPFEAVEEQLYTAQLHRALDALLDELPDRDALVIRARYFEGRPQRETAAALGCAVSRVGQLERRGLRALQKKPQALAEYREHIISSHAYRGTGLGAWKHSGSVEERIVERLDERGAL